MEDITEVKNDDTTVDSGDSVEQNEAEETTAVEETTEEVVEETKVEKPKQDNSANAKRRIENKHKREVEDAKVQAIIDYVGTNPFTGEPIKDKADVELYKDMMQAKKEGRDPVTELGKYYADKKRKQAEESRLERENQERYDREQAEFHEKYPDVDIEQLANDEDFQDYAEGKIGVHGKKTLAEVYAGYQTLMSKYEKKAEDKAVRIVAKGKTSTGNLNNANGLDNTTYTMQEVAKMTDAEYEAIKKSGALARSQASWYKK